MREERLLERIRSRAKTPDRSTQEDPKRIVDSVVEHLQKLLNTRQGGAQIAPDFGMPDYNEALRGQSGASREIEKSIRQSIQKYEPRLKAVRVRFIPLPDDLLSLNFEIYARLSIGDSEQTVVFESLMDEDGQIRIRS
jgi:type VI secretion system protein